MPSAITDVLEALHRELLPLVDGNVATYIPELARVDPDAFGVALSTPDGARYAAGDADLPFTIQSVSKPFVMALAIEDRGIDAFLAAVGVEPTGDPFNAVTLEPETGRPLNPMVNAGAIVTSSLVAGEDGHARAQRIVDGLSAFAGRPLILDEQVLASELATADRNRAIAFLMRSMGSLRVDVEPALETYFTQCSIVVTARDVAVMAATLANGGRNPLSGATVVGPDVVTHVLSVMVTCGMYDYSGQWMFRTGMPAKSGVGGGIAVVLPGEFGVGLYSPRLDTFGNSVRGVAACELLSRRFGLHVMRSRARLGSPVRRRLHGDAVHSRRGRPAAERELLGGLDDAIVVYELQGDLTFVDAEHVARRALAESCRWLILDASRIGQVDPVAAALLEATAANLEGRAVVVHLAGPWGPGVMPSIDRRFPTASDAIEWCEDLLVGEAGLPGPDDEIPLARNDLCRALADHDLALLAAASVPISHRAGEMVGHDGTPLYPVMFIVRGRVGIEDETAPVGSGGIATRAAGTAVGSLVTFADGRGEYRLVARTDVSPLAPSVAALVRLEQEHPRLTSALYRAMTQAIAAEYRSVAAENAGLA